MHTRYRRRFTRLALLVALGCAGLLLLAAHHRVATTSAGHVSHPRTAAIPLAFEQNDGQHDAAIRYSARGPGYAVAMLDNGVALSVRNTGARPSRVAMQFGNGVTHPTGEAPLAGRANYLLGRDARDWRRNIPTFGRVQVQRCVRGHRPCLLRAGSAARIRRRRRARRQPTRRPNHVRRRRVVAGGPRWLAEARGQRSRAALLAAHRVPGDRRNTHLSCRSIPARGPDCLLRGRGVPTALTRS